jgi:hypothetical protein
MMKNAKAVAIAVECDFKPLAIPLGSACATAKFVARRRGHMAISLPFGRPKKL